MHADTVVGPWHSAMASKKEAQKWPTSRTRTSRTSSAARTSRASNSSRTSRSATTSSSRTTSSGDGRTSSNSSSTTSRVARTSRTSSTAASSADPGRLSSAKGPPSGALSFCAGGNRPRVIPGSRQAMSKCSWCSHLPGADRNGHHVGVARFQPATPSGVALKVHHLNCIPTCPLGGHLMDGRTRGVFTRASLACHCLLVEAGNRLVLVDTGLGLRDVAHPRDRLSAFFLGLLAPDLRAEMTAARQLQALGYAPAD